MDKRKSILNVSISVLFKVLTVFIVIFVRRLLIQTCGNGVNGLNALYISIIGFLSVAELGVGSAITFCMYKPIVDGNTDKVSALYHLFRRLYLIIGGIILLSGLIIMPFLPQLAKDYTQLDVNLYTTFLLMLFSVVITYLYGSKTALINAYKNNYITTAISSGGLILQYVLQITTLLITKSFNWYLGSRIFASLAQWLVTEFIVRRKYTPILRNKQKIDAATRQEVTKNVKAMFMHKVGAKLVNSADSIVISMFVGVIALGEYSNYTTIQHSMVGVLTLVFTSLTSVIGHLYAKKGKELTRKYCEAFHLLNFVIATVFHLGYYAIVDNLVAILFSPDLVVEKSISIVITLNGFVQFMRRNTLTFRDATGAFYSDRWKPLFEGVLNIILSVLMVQWVGVTGVIIATIITNLILCHVIEPYVLYKHSFSASPRKYYLVNYGMILLFLGALFLLDSIMVSAGSQWKELFLNGCLSVGVSAVSCAIAALLDWDSCKFAITFLKKR